MRELVRLMKTDMIWRQLSPIAIEGELTTKTFNENFDGRMMA